MKRLLYICFLEEEKIILFDLCISLCLIIAPFVKLCVFDLGHSHRVGIKCPLKHI